MKLGDATKETLPDASTLNKFASSPERLNVIASPSTSMAVTVKRVTLAATVSLTSKAESSFKVGLSLTASTVKVIVALVETVPSDAESFKSPNVVLELLALRSEEKDISASWVEVSVMPAASMVPSAAVRVIPVGIESTVIVRLSPSSSVGAPMEKVLGVSSVKLSALLANTGALLTVGVGVTGVDELPPPPPPQAARANAFKFAKSMEDLELSFIVFFVNFLLSSSSKSLFVLLVISPIFFT